jgi:hypothetical protein
MLLYLLIKVLYGQLCLNGIRGYKFLHRYMNLDRRSVWLWRTQKSDFRKNHQDKISVKYIGSMDSLFNTYFYSSLELLDLKVFNCLN